MRLGWQQRIRYRIDWTLRHKALWAWSGCLAILVLGVVVAPAAGQQRTVTKHGDWQAVCLPNGACYAEFSSRRLGLLIGRDRRAGPLRASIVVDAKAGPGAPVTLRTDAGVSVDLPVTSCNEQFCEAAVAVDKTGILVTTINKATSGMAAYLIGNRIVMVPVSFRGSSAAIRAIGG
jgi:hypothetical protein